jgi:hypothetical protein
MAASITATFHRGEDVYWPFVLNAAQAAARGWSSIAGKGFLLTIRDEKSLTSAYHQTVAVAVTNGPALELDAHITDTVNEALPAGAYVIDLWSTDADNEFCWGEGQYTLTPTPRVP